MEFNLMKFEIDITDGKAERRFKTLQPSIYGWLENHQISISQRKTVIGDVQIYVKPSYWGRPSYTQKLLQIVDLYVEIPDVLLEEWSKVHINKYVLQEAATQWDKIYKVGVGKTIQGITPWSRQNIKDEYFVSGRTWGFKNKNDALYFGMVWK